ncbi:MAG: Tfp pilus assembly protein PilF, partial [Acidobacteria bacterium]|nr:Tfp pilus assembly protein PilF [Acidobacteriota bacterium]
IALGNSYLRQSKYDDSIAAFRRAGKIYEKSPNEPHVGLLYSLARYYYFTGKYAESERLFLQLLPLAEQAKDGNVAWYRKGYALVLYAQGKTAPAEKMFRESVETLKTGDNSDRDLATSWHELATLLTSLGKYADAEPLFKQAIAMREKALGGNHPELAASLEGYAAMLTKMGRADEAAPLEHRAQTIRANPVFRE